MDDVLPSLIGFAIATSITPGPNNVMVAASAANHGLRATIPHIFGIGVGFAVMLALVGLGLAEVFLAYPAVHTILRWAMAAWLVLLAWKIGTAARAGGDQRPRPPLGFIGAALFQWVNPKAWLIAIAAVGEFMSANQSLLPQVGVVALTFMLVCTPCVGAWAAMGSGAGALLGSPRRLRAFNVTMALLLLASVLPMLREF